MLTQAPCKRCGKMVTTAVHSLLGLDELKAQLADELDAFADGLEALKAIAEKQQAQLLEALIDLVDVQNGPPLPKYAEEWEKAMKVARALIAAAAEREKP